MIGRKKRGKKQPQFTIAVKPQGTEDYRYYSPHEFVAMLVYDSLVEDTDRWSDMLLGRAVTPSDEVTSHEKEQSDKRMDPVLDQGLDHVAHLVSQVVGPPLLEEMLPGMAEAFAEVMSEDHAAVLMRFTAPRLFPALHAGLRDALTAYLSVLVDLKLAALTNADYYLHGYDPDAVPSIPCAVCSDVLGDLSDYLEEEGEEEAADGHVIFDLFGDDDGDDEEDF